MNVYYVLTLWKVFYVEYYIIFKWGILFFLFNKWGNLNVEIKWFLYSYRVGECSSW